METLKAPKKVTKKKIAQTKKDILEVFSHSTFGSQCLGMFAAVVILKEKEEMRLDRIKELERDARSLNSMNRSLHEQIMLKKNEINDLRAALKAKMKK